MTTEQIIEELGIEHSSDDFKSRMVSKILATADLRFARIIDDVLTEEEHQEFQSSLEGRSLEEVGRWVDGNYENAAGLYTDVVRSIVRDLKNQGAQ